MRPEIEISPEDYWIRRTYQESMLYCFSLIIDGKTGWRLPTPLERAYVMTRANGPVWVVNPIGRNSSYTAYCIPVRDIK